MALDNTELAKSGIDYVEAMERFGNNEDLYLRLAVKVLDDPHFPELQKAMDREDIEGSQREAHSLKGVAGNLSFKDLYRAACKMNEVLNASDMDGAWELMPDTQDAYDRVCDALRKLRD